MDNKKLEDIKTYLRLRKIEENDTLAKFIGELGQEIQKEQQENKNNE